MTENDPNDTVETAAEQPAKKAKAKDKSKDKAKAKLKAKSKTKSKTKAPRVKAKKPAETAPAFDYVGKVDSLRIASGAGAEGFEFGLKARHGKRKRFRFDPADAFAMNAMAHLVLAAHAAGTKLGVRTAPEADGILIVREVESRHKLEK